MNKGRFVWGVICLALAALLVILIVVLPPGQLSFNVGSQNLPWVPALVLAAAGAVLLATAGLGSERPSPAGEAEAAKPKPAVDPAKAALNKRLEGVAWGLFLIMLGGFMLVPEQSIPKGVWSIGVGLIMLGLNAARYGYKIRMSGFTTVLGILSLLGGIGELLGFVSLDGALLLIILGAYLLLKPWFDKNKVFGKAEEA